MSVTATRLHTVGATLFALTGIAHTIGQYLPARLDPGSAAVETAMKQFVIPDTSFTYWNIMQCWGALYGGMTFLFGLGLLVAARASGGEPRVLRATAAVGALAAALQAAAALVYRTPPPAFFMVPASLVMVAAGIAAGRRPA